MAQQSVTAKLTTLAAKIEFSLLSPPLACNLCNMYFNLRALSQSRPTSPQMQAHSTFDLCGTAARPQD